MKRYIRIHSLLFLVLITLITANFCFSQDPVAVNKRDYQEGHSIYIMYDFNTYDPYKYYYIEMYWVVYRKWEPATTVEPSVGAVIGANNFKPTKGGADKRITWDLNMESNASLLSGDPRIIISEIRLTTKGQHKVKRIDLKLLRLKRKRDKKILKGKSTKRIDERINRYEELKRRKYVEFNSD